MEFCDAGSLAGIMNKTGSALTEDQIRVVLSDALKGLEYLHKEKKIHRDIKADNILLNAQGEAKLGSSKIFFFLSLWKSVLKD
jgi:serine/threonine protein kinase